MKELRKVSILIPYTNKSGEILIFMQKRAQDAKRYPGYFGFFGGGMEGDETPEETLLREMKEELNFIPEGYEHFGHYESKNSIKEVFTLEVDMDFDKNVTVLEGESGQWFSEEQIFSEKKLIKSNVIILKEFYNSMRAKK